VIYSTSSAQRDVDEKKKLGADYFITKPSTFKELCEKIKYMLSTYCNHINQE